VSIDLKTWKMLQKRRGNAAFLYDEDHKSGGGERVPKETPENKNI